MSKSVKNILHYLKSLLFLVTVFMTNPAQSIEPSPPKKAVGAIQFTNAMMTAACAPHDAPSIMISIMTQKKDYPLITLNWWATPIPSAKGGTFIFESKGKQPFDEGYQGYFCAVKGACEELKAAKIKVLIDAKTKASTIQFEVESGKNEVQKGQVPAKVNFDTQHMCG